MKRIATSLVGMAAASAMVLLGSPSAYAGDHIGNTVFYLDDNRGSMTHIDDGDRFMVCDTRADGHGVSGTLWKDDDKGGASLVARVDDGGDAGCDAVTYDIKTGEMYFMTLTWNGDDWGTYKQQSVWE